MLKILVTYAVQGEFAEIKWPDVEVYYVRTGIGKVKAAFHLAEAIRQVEPDIVINMGTAGTINHRVGDVYGSLCAGVCLYFQRDSFYFSEICIGRDWAELCKTLGRQTG